MTKILIVDDHEPILDMVEECLVNYDYEVIKSINGKKGLEMINKVNPDLVLCDIEMPEMDGHALLHAVRNQTKFSDLPFNLSSEITNK